MPLLLASTSPRRAELLRNAGIPFDAMDPATDEHDDASGLTPEELVLENARLKALAVAGNHPGRVVLGADTTVVLDGGTLGKPASFDEARSMLRRLSGREHLVLTGVVLATNTEGPNPRVIDEFVESTSVRFLTLGDDVIETYLSRVNVLDKAGAYGIQEQGDLIVSGITGLLSNVVGLPVERLPALLARHGL